jgi:hypothetical protein
MAATLLWEFSAHAVEPASASAPVAVASGTAERRAEADRLYGAGKFEAAAKLYDAIGAETQDFGYRCFVGSCLERLGRLDEAMTAIHQCLGGLPASAPQAAGYRTMLSDLEARTGTDRRAEASAQAPTPTPAPVPAAAPPPAVPSDPARADLVSRSAEPAPRKRSLSGIIVGATAMTVGLLGGAVCSKGAEAGFANVSKKYDRDIEDRAGTLNVLQFIGYGIAGAGAAMLIISLIGDGDEPAAATASSPHVIATRTGAGVGWRF